MTIVEYFGFRAYPFSKEIAARDLYRYPHLDQLWARLNAAIAGGRGMVITGRAGMGKTTAIRGCLELNAAKHKVIYLGQYQRGSALLAQLGMEFGIRKNILGARRMVNLVERVTQESAAGRRLVLVIDEAHLLEKPTFEDIRLLTNTQMDSKSPLSLIMLGQKWLRGMLKADSQEALYQRLTLRYALEGLGEEQTAEYIAHHLRLAGCTEKLFRDESIKLIFVASEGIPREINNLCYECLIEAMARNTREISAEIVSWVIDQRELC